MVVRCNVCAVSMDPSTSIRQSNGMHSTLGNAAAWEASTRMSIGFCVWKHVHVQVAQHDVNIDPWKVI